jgi:hypothetical protein
VGHSTGGALALRAAIDRPDLVTSLVLAAPSIHTEGFPALVRSMFRTRLGKQLVLQLLRTEVGEVAIRRSWFEPKNIPADVLLNFKRVMKLPRWHEALMEMASTQDPNAKLSERLSSVHVPCLILHGEQDKLVNISESVRALKQLNSHPRLSKLVRIQSCGHVPHEEFPHIFLDCVATFLSTLPSLRSSPRQQAAASLTSPDALSLGSAALPASLGLLAPAATSCDMPAWDPEVSIISVSARKSAGEGQQGDRVAGDTASVPVPVPVPASASASVLLLPERDYLGAGSRRVTTPSVSITYRPTPPGDRDGDLELRSAHAAERKYSFSGSEGSCDLNSADSSDPEHDQGIAALIR